MISGPHLLELPLESLDVILQLNLELVILLAVLDEHVLDFLSVLLLSSSPILEKLELRLLSFFVQRVDLLPVLVEQLISFRQERVLDRLELHFIFSLQFLELLAHAFQQLIDVFFLLF